MTDELKTLKEIFDDEWFEVNDLYDIDVNEVVDKIKEDLKAEAVKWVKEDEELCLSDMSSAAVIDTLIRRWKDRFNLTEDDLK